MNWVIHCWLMFISILSDLATDEELNELRKRALEVNDCLLKLLLPRGLLLVDFKLEFGRDSSGNLLLADEYLRTPVDFGMRKLVKTGQDRLRPRPWRCN